METTGEVRVEAGQSGEIDKVAAALVAVQGEMTNPPKTKTVYAGPKKYSFAPLPEILDAVRPVLKKHGLAVVQLPRDRALETRVLHTSGQWIGGAYSLPASADSQAMGSAITYARRYSLCAVLGIAGEDDEDGEAATAAELEEQAARRKEAEGRLDAMKGKGKIKSAYDGKVLAPGEATLPAERAGGVETADRRPQTADLGTQGKTPASAATPSSTSAKATADTTARRPRDARSAGGAAPAAADALAGIAKPLADLMRRDGVSPEVLKRYYVVIRKHLPDTVEATDLPPDYVENLTKAENWKRVVAAIKGGK